ncbi:MAG: YbjN domain-containing protein [Sphingomonadales bacterium]
MKLRLAVAALALWCSGAAAAQTVTAATPQSVVAALQAGGYKAVLSKDSSGDPRVESAASGSKFVVTFYGCTKNVACKTVTFYAGWSGGKATQDQINEWNMNRRFSRAYIDKDGDPVIEFDVDLDDGGMSQALFVDNLQFWESAMGGFKKHLGL